MSFKTRITLFDNLPFSFSFRPEIAVSKGVVMARWPYIGTYVIIRDFAA
jgi:hypothetical protein